MKKFGNPFGLHQHSSAVCGGWAAAKLRVVAGLFALAIAGQVSAGCGFGSSAAVRVPTVFGLPAAPSGHFLAAVYRPGVDGRFLKISDDDGGWPGEPAIVGMWSFQLIGLTGLPPGVPAGAVIDDGYAQWHSDGTEIQNSGVHAPNTSNFCLGVWKQVGPTTYKLNHLPLGWDPAANGGSGSPANAIQLTETVRVTDGDHMTGTFTLKVYVWTSTNSLDVASATPVATITGNVIATRVTINSVVPGS